MASNDSAFSTKLHQEGLLPGLAITDSNSGSVTLTSADGKVQTVDSHCFGKKLEGQYKCPAPPPYDPARGDQNPAREELRCLKLQEIMRIPHGRPTK